MKAEEIHSMSTRELRQKLEDNREELFNLRFQIATRKIKNHQRIPLVKKDIARIMTALRERELMAQYTGMDLEDVEPTPNLSGGSTTARGGGLLGRLRRGR